MADKLDPAAVALRRSPTVPQPVQVEPATGNLYGLVDGRLHFWPPTGFRPYKAELSLVPLVTKREPLRCWAKYDRFGNILISTDCPHESWTPMIEAAELDRVRAAGATLAGAVDVLLAEWCAAELSHGLSDAVRTYREAVK